MNPIVIFGPTSSGKSDIAMFLAKKHDGEIICADSRQIYKEFRITSGAPNKQDTISIEHHGFFSYSIKTPITVFTHVADIHKYIQEVKKKNKLPIIVGGTGLVIRALLYEYQPIAESHNTHLQQSLESLDLPSLQSMLKKEDPLAYSSIDRDNKRRIIRAISCIQTTGISITQGNAQKNEEYQLISPPIPSREWLYEKINTRMKTLWEHGMFEELSILNLPHDHPLFHTIGYQETKNIQSNTMTHEQALESIQRRSRNYAKRQLTFYNQFKDYPIHTYSSL